MNVENPEIEETELETPQVEESSESVADSIRAAMEELGDDGQADQDLQGDQGETAPTEEETKEAARTLAKSKKTKRQTYEAKDLDVGGKGKQDTQAATPERLEPPIRFPVDKKEWFNKQPRELQEEIHRTFREQEAHFTKTSQNLAREKARYAEVNQIIDNYLPRWGIAGLTPQAAIAELCAAQDMIAKDPITAYNLMLQRSGLSPEDLIEARDGQGYGARPQAHQQQRYQPAPEILDLTNKVNTLYSQLEQQQQAQEQAAIGSAVAEVAAVRNEISADGTYLYPELWDPVQFPRVQPFMDDLRKTQPSLSWSEVAKRAVNTLRILDGRGSPSPASQRLPNPDYNRIKAAAVSVSGRGNGAVPVSGYAKQGESVEDSVRAVMAGLQQRH